MSAETIDIHILRGCDYRIRMRLTQPPSAELGDVDLWPMQLEVRRVKGSASATYSFAGSLANLPRASELGIFDFTLSAAQTALLTDRTYFYAIRRTDTGFSNVFTKGILHTDAY